MFILLGHSTKCSRLCINIWSIQVCKIITNWAANHAALTLPTTMRITWSCTVLLSTVNIKYSLHDIVSIYRIWISCPLIIKSHCTHYMLQNSSIFLKRLELYFWKLMLYSLHNFGRGEFNGNQKVMFSIWGEHSKWTGVKEGVALD